MLFGKFHTDSSDSKVIYKNSTSSTSSLHSFFSFSSLFNFTFLYNKAIREYDYIYLLTSITFQKLHNQLHFDDRVLVIIKSYHLPSSKL